jgi:hypothetical protein
VPVTNKQIAEAVALLFGVLSGDGAEAFEAVCLDHAYWLKRPPIRKRAQPRRGV